MGLFRRKRDDFIDLTERYKQQQAKLADSQADSGFVAVESTTVTTSSSDDSGGGFGIFGSMAAANSETPSSDSGVVDLGASAEEKKRKLAKRLMDMTEKIEDLSNQIYHLQQRIEVLERKGGSY